MRNSKRLKFILVFLFIFLQVFSFSQVNPLSGNSKSFPKTSVKDHVSNSDKSTDIEMILVEGGTFTMGCTALRKSDCISDEAPQHSVTLEGFYIGKYEITQLQWRIIMGSDPPELNFKGCDNCPAERISWNDAMEFISKLNQLTGKTYRLPTEAEWEYAARGGNKSKSYTYSGSNNADDVAWFNKNSSGRTHNAGLNKANELGLFDMSGNAWEWCQDWYEDTFYTTSPGLNPVNLKTGQYKVLRGGSWIGGTEMLRVSRRHRNSPGDRGLYSGLRLVRPK